MCSDTHNKRTNFNTLYAFSWTLVFYTVLIIAWGAWVRISGSGDGCGDHWPLCHGMAVPLGASTKTWIEVSHRYSTAMYGIAVFFQVLVVRLSLPHRHPARRWVYMTLLFTITEALIGMLLVKNGLVHRDTSVTRIFIMPLHLVNTSLLLSSAVITAESIRFGRADAAPIYTKIRVDTLLLAIGLLILLITGAIAALGSHLLPSQSLLEGLYHDFHTDSHPAVRLRVLHPILGLMIPMGLWLTCSYFATTRELSQVAQSAKKALMIGALTGMVVGALTLGLLTPTWLKLTHLTVANILVILAARYVYHSNLGPLSDPPPDFQPKQPL